jgi:SAM-dependent methyltransferase
MSNWYEHFFHGLALEMWNALMTPEATRAESDFLEAKLALRPGARVLDVPCGNGRHSIELAARGYRVSAIDIAEENILAARGRNSEAEFECANMSRMAYASEFDAAFCWGNSFAYMDDAGNREFLEAIARALKPGARFVLDTGLVAEAILPTFQPRRWYRLRDLIFLSSVSYNAQISQVRSEYTYVKGDRIETGEAIYAIYTVAELRRMFEAVGLKPVAMLGSLDGQPFAIGHQRLLVVAERSV